MYPLFHSVCKYSSQLRINLSVNQLHTNLANQARQYWSSNCCIASDLLCQPYPEIINRLFSVVAATLGSKISISFMFYLQQYHTSQPARATTVSQVIVVPEAMKDELIQTNWNETVLFCTGCFCGVHTQLHRYCHILVGKSVAVYILEGRMRNFVIPLTL